MNANGHITDAMEPEDFRQGRRNGGALRVGDPRSADRLPPHSVEAEQGTLGCVMLAPMECLAECERQRVEPEWFYDLRHRGIYQAVRNMRTEGMAEGAGERAGEGMGGNGGALTSAATGGIDMVTVHQRLSDHGHLEECGGVDYLAALPDTVPSAANLRYYLDILREKWVLRNIVGTCADTISRAYEFSGDSTALVTQLERDIQVFARGMQPPDQVDTMYVSPLEMGDEHYQRWFGKTHGVPGLPLPASAFGEFPFKIRPCELTLLDAETKMGKSTMASYIMLHLIAQAESKEARDLFPNGMKLLYDSREVHRVETLKKFANQLLGRISYELCLVGHEQRKEKSFVECRCGVCGPALSEWREAHEWLGRRLKLNLTTGIKHWRDILQAFYRLAELGFHLFVLDNLMRIGIQKDDWNAQADAVAAFAQFCVDTGSHMFLIAHRTKNTDGDYRKKTSGAHEITANSHNLCTVWKNEKKFEKLGPWVAKLKDPEQNYSYDEFLSDAADLLKLPDAKFILNDQRLDGGRSNASRELWFLKRSGQYFDYRPPKPRPSAATNWLEKWRGRMTNDPNQDIELPLRTVPVAREDARPTPGAAVNQ